ncbi:MAG: 30S ribosome-binding factor RbfA [Elusimicrobia bacterium]|nr:30S ribosome-binding factor RbfA [Elusimicrobiota bacterium]
MYSRNDRLNTLLLSEVGLALRGVKDPGLAGMVTLTGVDMSADRKVATVYYSVFGESRERQSTSQALKRAAPYVRHVLSKRLSMKVIPQVVFRYDETPQRASRVEAILNKLSEPPSRSDRSGTPAPDTPGAGRPLPMDRGGGTPAPDTPGAGREDE